MAFSNLLSNQMVNETDAQSGGFTLKSGQSNVTSTLCMTKLSALTRYNLTVALMSGYLDNQLVPKSVWQSAVVAEYNATMTVGNSFSSYGFRRGGFGALSSEDMGTIQSGARLREMYFQNNATRPYLQILIEGSTTVEPIFSSVSMGSSTYARSDFAISHGNNSPLWFYVVYTSTNPFGFTTGATRAIKFIG